MTSEIAELLRQCRECSRSGQLEAAARLCEQILTLEPENAEAHYQLGVIALKRQRPGQAIDCISQAVQFDPGNPEFHVLLGIAHSSLGNLPEGALCFQRAIELNPDDQFAHNNLGRNYKGQGRLTDAEQCFRAAISIDPDFVDAHVSLGDLLGQRGELPAATEAYRRALKIKPEDTTVLYRLALILHHMHDNERAAELFGKIADSHPAYPGVFNMLGVSLMKLGQYDDAIESYEKAASIDPSSPAPHVNLGHALVSRGQPGEAVAHFRRTLAIDPDHAPAYSNLLITLNYLPDVTQETLFQESLRFEQAHASGLQSARPFRRDATDVERVLRIGYVSPDFRAHSVAHFTWRLIGAHNRNNVEVFCYADVMKQDEVTDGFRTRADHWLSIVGLTDEAVADRIRDDRIDILVDLAGHTANSRPLVFARKPAPVQVSWLGYPNTTGLKTMDYRLTDAVADPEGDADRLHAEELIRLPHGFLCYQTDDPNPPVTPPPCLECGHVTFGSFNHLPKLTPEVIRVWSRVLQSLPEARLVMKSGPLIDANTRARYLKQFAGHGITADRVDLVGKIPSREKHLQMYSTIDICLDPFPYNGTTTTFEALWMGVPVICLRGDRHAGRVGASIMHHLGLPELVAETEAEYVDLAKKLAGDTDQLITLRDDLRTRLHQSVLMNVPLFTETLEKAYRRMWATWCDHD